MQTKRLKSGERDTARQLFAVMADVFNEECEALNDGYIDRLLAREDFWMLAALLDDQVIAGLTAHSLPMTTAEESELFLYDIAVRRDHQRTGVGRRLITELLEKAAACGIKSVFVAADNEDVHALDFYRALDGTAGPVTVFTFSPRAITDNPSPGNQGRGIAVGLDPHAQDRRKR
jgi:aminoglycoside 3-N-acetyltransferase I